MIQGKQEQGEQHYVEHYIFGDQQELQTRDNKKAQLCKEHNVKLVTVPFWWDRSEVSLRASIQAKFPHLQVSMEGMQTCIKLFYIV